MWSIEEEYLFFESQGLLGNKWTSLSKLFPSKSSKQLKNHFYSCIIKMIRKIVRHKHDSFSLFIRHREIKEIIITYYALTYLRQIFANKHYLLILQKKAYKCKKKKNVTLKKLILAHDLSSEIVESYYQIFERSVFKYLNDVYRINVSINIPQFFNAIVKTELLTRSLELIEQNVIHSKGSIEVLQNFIESNTSLFNIKEQLQAN